MDSVDYEMTFPDLTKWHPLPFATKLEVKYFVSEDKIVRGVYIEESCVGGRLYNTKQIRSFSSAPTYPGRMESVIDEDIEGWLDVVLGPTKRKSWREIVEAASQLEFTFGEPEELC